MAVDTLLMYKIPFNASISYLLFHFSSVKLDKKKCYISDFKLFSLISHFDVDFGFYINFTSRISDYIK